MLIALLVVSALVPLGVSSPIAQPDERKRQGERDLSSRTEEERLEVSVSNGGRPFDGDRRLFTTISPNGDGSRDKALVRLRLTRPAVVRLTIARTAREAHAVYRSTRSLSAGFHTFAWAPSGKIPPRTYLTFIEVRDRAGVRSFGAPDGDPRRGQETPAIQVLGVDASFHRDSYRRGDRARLRITADTSGLAVQIFRSGPERFRTRRNDEMNGIAVSKRGEFDWTHRRGATHSLSIDINSWPTGLYFAKVTASDGRVGFAPFVVRPPLLGTNRIAVVLPTNTWQAYNFGDGDGDGWGDTWYVHPDQQTIRTDRPHLDRGVPLRFRVYDLPFLHWLEWHGRRVDYLAQRDLELVRGGRTLRRAYDLVVFPGHHEYVTTREFDVITRFRDLGGSLMFLSANNFYWRVDRRGPTLRRIAHWRDLGRPEAALVGVQYIAYGSHRRGPYVVRDARAVPWLFAGTRLWTGSRFGTFGIEIDKTAPASPSGTRVIAEIPNLYGPGLTAQMTYYQTRRGARVFAAGAFTLAGSATRPYGSQLLNNLWRHMSDG